MGWEDGIQVAQIAMTSLVSERLNKQINQYRKGGKTPFFCWQNCVRLITDEIRAAEEYFDGDYEEEPLRLMRIKFMSEVGN